MTAKPFRPGFIAVLIAAVVTAFAQQGLPIVANGFRDADHLTLAAMGGLMTAVALGTLGGMILWGHLIDRWGTLRTLEVSLFAMLILLTFVAVLPHQPYPLLVVCLTGLGLALPGLPLTGMRWTVAAGSSGHLGIALSVRQAATPLGGLIAALVLTPLLDRWSLRMLVILVGIALLVAGGTLGSVFRMAEVRLPDAPRTDEPVPHSLRSLAPVLIVAGLVGSGPYLVLTYGVVTQRTGTLGVTPWLAMVQIGAIVGRVGAGWWSDRAGQTARVLSCVTALGALTLAALASGIGVRGSAVLVLGDALILGVGISAWNGLLYAWATTRVEPSKQGAALGWVGAATFLSVAVASLIFGLLAQRWGVGAGWAVTAGAFALASIVAGLTDRRDVFRAARP